MDIFRLTNDELLRHTENLAADVRTKTGDLIESLAEIDRRKLYEGFSYTSLFEYCVYRLRMSDAAAYRRIRAARAIRAYPPVGPLLRTGKLSLEALALIHPYLNDSDAGSLVAQASGKRVWEVERLAAARRTEAPRRDVVRFVPALTPPPAPAGPDPQRSLLLVPSEDSNYPPTPTSPAADPQATAPRETVPKRAPIGIRIAFTADEGFFKLLKEAQAAMRHKYPNGRLDGVFRDALVALLKKKGRGPLSNSAGYFFDRPFAPAAPKDTMPNR